MGTLYIKKPHRILKKEIKVKFLKHNKTTKMLIIGLLNTETIFLS